MGRLEYTSMTFEPLLLLDEPPLLLLELLLLLPQAPSTSTVPASKHPVTILPR
jgi:hypothetical protein